jgi:hypothetical protein
MGGNQEDDEDDDQTWRNIIFGEKERGKRVEVLKDQRLISTGITKASPDREYLILTTPRVESSSEIVSR